VLLPHGVTPKKFSKLARSAFIRAAAERAQLRNGRINRSKVAALTGLSRREIARILDPTAKPKDPGSSTGTPAERVVSGWQTHPQFTTSQGQPRILEITGGASSFQSLVRKFGGDISPRAVLEELKRSNTVRHIGKRVKLRLAKRSKPSPFNRIMHACIGDMSRPSSRPFISTDPLLFRLRLQANSESDLAMIRERCSSGIQSLLYGLEDSLKYPLTISARSRSPRHALYVTVLLADSHIARDNCNSKIE
jgi:Family of unknown function (DUF6502)